METVRIENLSFRYPQAEENALDDVCLSIEPSSFVVVCGRSGCGKSTLLRHLKKNLAPYGEKHGSIFFHGVDLMELDERENASSIGFVQQSPENQIVTDRVYHELAFGLESLGYDPLTIRRRVAEMASFFDIQGWFRKSVTELSGGQKQILNLASIMVMQPDLLILDEPTAQLDPIAASEFFRILYRVNRELGITVILSEHRMDEVFPIADKVLVLDEGKVTAYDSPSVVGQKLTVQNHPVFYGLPSVMRVYGAVDGRGSFPMTIRDGRLWLEDILGEAKNQDCSGKEERTQRDVIASFRNVHFRYDKKSGEVLRGLNLDIRRGEWLSIMGGNGVGKSTLCKLLCGIYKCQEGKILVDGIDAGKDSQKLFDHLLAMVPQNPQALFTEITVEEELFEALRHMPYHDAEKVSKLEAMISCMELSGKEKVHPYDLSGGEQQRLAIGKILLLEPRVLVMDEPTKGLDAFFKRTLSKILKDLKNQGLTIVLISHDMDFSAENSDRCAMLFDGEIVCVEDTDSFFSGNSFYTTSVNQMAGKWFPRAVTAMEVIACIQEEN